MIESRVIKKYNEPHCLINENEHPELEAKMAISFIEKWGMISGMDDGEDSSGRQKIRMATPEEVVERAFQIAKLTMDKARKDRLIHNAPTFGELGIVELPRAERQNLLENSE